MKLLLKKLLSLFSRKERKRISTYASFSTLAEASLFKNALVSTREDVILEDTHVEELPEGILVHVFYSAYEPLP